MKTKLCERRRRRHKRMRKVRAGKTGRNQKKPMVKRMVGIQKGKKHNKKRANMRGK